MGSNHSNEKFVQKDPKEFMEKWKRKSFVLEMVHQKGYSLQYTSSKLKNDKKVVLTAVKNNGKALEFASEHLKNDKEVVLEAIRNKGELKYVSDNLCNDKEVVLEAVKINGSALEYASKNLQNDKEIVLAAVSQNGYSKIQFASKELLEDEEVIKTSLKNCKYSIQYLLPKTRKDKEITLLALKFGADFSFIDDSFKNDKEFILEVFKSNISKSEIGKLGTELLKDFPFILSLMKEYRDFSEISSLPKITKKFMKEALKIDGKIMKYYTYYANDPEIILLALENGFPFSEIHKYIHLYQNDEITLLKMIHINENIFLLFEDNFPKKINKQFILKAVNANPNVYQLLSKIYQNDQDVFTMYRKIYNILNEHVNKLSDIYIQFY